MFNKAGKTLTVFVASSLVLLTSSTSIGFFLYHKEQQLFKNAVADRDASRDSEGKLQAELKEVKKQLTLWQDKNKEADQKINSLLDEMDLNEGVRTELKKENSTLKEQLDDFNKSKDKTKTDLDDAVVKIKQFQDLLKAEQEKSKDLQSKLDGLEQTKKDMEGKISELKGDVVPHTPQDQIATEVIPPGKGEKPKMELDKIVVNPGDGTKGHILSIDKEAEFIVFNLGSKQGVKSGDILSVYRGDEYLGDVKATRVQVEMAAADIIPPFSSRKARKNDTVVLKP